MFSLLREKNASEIRSVLFYIPLKDVSKSFQCHRKKKVFLKLNLFSSHLAHLAAINSINRVAFFFP